MVQAIEQLRTGLRIGHATLGAFGQGVGSPKQQVHDGDTVTVEAKGNLGVRLLGVDAPEVSFTIRGQEGFITLSDPRWETILSDPFDSQLPGFDPPIDPRLRAHLRRRVGPGSAANHAQHAEEAHRALERQVEGDLQALEQPKESFEFFMAFGAEVMDRYGRLLGYVNRHQPDPETPEPRPLTYNERLLQAGMVSPYFIWPNVNPSGPASPSPPQRRSCSPATPKMLPRVSPRCELPDGGSRTPERGRSACTRSPALYGSSRSRSGSWAGGNRPTGG
jgi:endonuclease YncB( thermonuclease family)